MSDNASLARPYAKALFELVSEDKEVTTKGAELFANWSTALNKLSLISQDAEFNEVANDPRVDSNKLVDLVADLAGDDLPEGGKNFVTLLVQNGRLDSLTDIESLFRELVAKSQAKVNAEVTTAFALTDSQKSALSSALEQRMGLKVELEEVIDAQLVGGAVIKVGDLVIDGSAKGRVEKLTTTLMR